MVDVVGFLKRVFMKLVFSFIRLIWSTGDGRKSDHAALLLQLVLGFNQSSDLFQQ